MVQVGDHSNINLNQAVADLFFGHNGFYPAADRAACEEFSRGFQAVTDIRLVAVNAAEVPHSYDDPRDIPIDVSAFTHTQKEERKQTFLSICRATYPDVAEETWERSFNFIDLAAIPGPFADAQRCDIKADENSIVGPRMKKEVRAVISVLTDWRWSNRAIYARRTGLAEDQIVKYPEGEGPRIMCLGHEVFGHGQQVYAPVGNEAIWKAEVDADNVGIFLLKILAADPRASPEQVRSLQETVALEAAVRTLAKFFKDSDFCATGLAINEEVAKSERDLLTFERVNAAMDEMRLRCCVEQYYELPEGQGKFLIRESDSATVQELLRAYRQGPWDTNKLAKSIPDCARLIHNAISCYIPPEKREAAVTILRTIVMKEHKITDPETLRTIGLVEKGIAALCSPAFGRPEIKTSAAEITRRSTVVPLDGEAPGNTRSNMGSQLYGASQQNELVLTLT